MEEGGDEKESLRLNTKNITHAPRLIPILLVRLPDAIHVIDAQHPLILRELHLTTEIMQVPDQRGEDLAVSRQRRGRHQVDDVLREVRVESALFRRRRGAISAAVRAAVSVCSHFAVLQFQIK